jgi:hypothetical protein
LDEAAPSVNIQTQQIIDLREVRSFYDGCLTGVNKSKVPANWRGLLILIKI